jgi:hypothetical protein
VKKTEGGETVLYINRYYEKNLTTSVVTTSYYLGDRAYSTKRRRAPEIHTSGPPDRIRTDINRP